MAQEVRFNAEYLNVTVLYGSIFNVKAFLLVSMKYTFIYRLFFFFLQIFIYLFPPSSLSSAFSLISFPFSFLHFFAFVSLLSPFFLAFLLFSTSSVLYHLFPFPLSLLHLSFLFFSPFCRFFLLHIFSSFNNCVFFFSTYTCLCPSLFSFLFLSFKILHD